MPANIYNVPILLIIYKRLETSIQVVKQLEKIRPSKIYISANGPNPDNPQDSKACENARSIREYITWPCEVVTNYRTEHLNAKESITSSITWFFNNVEYGIILEDDCVLTESFFPYAEELLNKYKDDDTVMCISSSNFLPKKTIVPTSYYFSSYPHIWGWASWKQSWEKFQINWKNETYDSFSTLLKSRFANKKERTYWKLIFNYINSGNIDTWDYQWMFSVWKNNGKAIIPSKNLVTNIGFGEDSTNTVGNSDKWNKTVDQIYKIETHPKATDINKQLDLLTADNLFQISKSAKTAHLKIRLARFINPKLKRKIKNIFYN